jgi:hypothetical protein
MNPELKAFLLHLQGAKDRGRVPRALFEEIFLQLSEYSKQPNLIAAE